MENKMKLLFFDIDGTLVNFEGVMPQSARDALLRARQNGHRIILCTGRSKCQIYDWLLDFGFDGMVCATGAYVEYEGKVISHDLIKKEALAKVIDFMEKEHILYGLQCAEHSVATNAGADGMIRMFCERFHFDKEQVMRFFGKTLIDEEPKNRTDVDKLIYYDSPVGIEKVRAALRPEFEVTLTSFDKPDESSGEITQTGVNKAYGMQKILTYLDKAREDVIAFGDGPNDLDMMRFAGCGVAMGNAGENVKAEADMVTDHIDEEGIYHAMRKLKLI